MQTQRQPKEVAEKNSWPDPGKPFSRQAKRVASLCPLVCLYIASSPDCWCTKKSEGAAEKARTQAATMEHDIKPAEYLKTFKSWDFDSPFPKVSNAQT